MSLPGSGAARRRPALAPWRDVEGPPHFVEVLLDPIPYGPVRREDIDRHVAPARPGVPELVGVEAARGGARDVVQLHAEMAVEDHREDVAGHGIDRMHAGGEGRDQDLA